MIFLVRHGLTEWNRERIFRGRKDIPLSGNGRTQAGLTARYIARYPVTRVYTSPLQRARETAEIIAGPHWVTVVEELTDVDFGAWEGLPAEEVYEKYPAEYALYRSRPSRVHFPAGESLQDCRERTAAAFAGIVESEPGASPVIVSHRVILKLLLLEILDMPTDFFWRLRVDTCGVSELEIENGVPVVHRINSVGHLGGEAGKTGDF
jgi:broad specificity phosphatase PhoE